MSFFRKRKEKETEELKSKPEVVSVKEVKVATAVITSSYNDCSGAGPICVKWYFLVREKDGRYYEIFSNRLIKEKKDTYGDGFISTVFDVPYIENVEPLTEYLKNPNEEYVKTHLLFDFILDMNVQKQLEIHTKQK